MPNTLEEWLAEAAKIERTDNPLAIPYEVALREAAEAAGFIKKYWDKDGTRPGLSRFAKRLPIEVADEIVSLVKATQQQQTKLLLLVDPAAASGGDRARHVIDELESAIGFLLDDGVEEAADVKYAQVRDFHSQDGQRSSALAQSLRDYAALAIELKTRLIDVDAEFDANLIDEASALADKLAAAPAASPSSSEVETTRVARNRLLHLIAARVSLVRTTAAHGFRHNPEIVRQATSGYERRRRAAARRAKGKDTPATPVLPPGDGA